MAMTVDRNALVFSSPNSFKYVPIENENENDFHFEMIGSSGEPFYHYFWENLAFDFEGMVFEKDKIPILWDHDRDRPIGFSSPPTITPDKKMLFTDEHVTFLEGNEDVKRFVSESKQGLPYQASICGEPTSIEYIPSGEKTEVNGHEFVGPGHIWRKFSMLECSITLFGADSNTESRVFTEGSTVELDDKIFVNGQGPHKFNNFKTPDKTGGTNMDWKKFQSEYPDEAARFTARIQEDLTKEMETKFSAEREGLTADLEKAKLMADEFKTKFEAADKENLAFKEASLRDEADKIFSTCFAASELPERLHDKLRKFTNSEKFIAEGKLDVEAFTKYVNEELEPWKTEFSEKPAAIQGGSVVKDAATGEELQFNAKDVALQMHKLSGNVIKTNKEV